MREIDRSSQFKRDYKREKRTHRGHTLETDLKLLIELLVEDLPLPAAYDDHPLQGEWKDFRDCHVRPDLILIYRKKGKSLLQLARLGSHAELNL